MVSSSRSVLERGSAARGSEDGARSGTWERDEIRDPCLCVRIPPFGQLLARAGRTWKALGKWKPANKTYLQHPQLTAVEVPVRAAADVVERGRSRFKISYDRSRFGGPLLEN